MDIDVVFCNGNALCNHQCRFRNYVQGYGNFRFSDYILDGTYYVVMDIEAALEPLPGDLQNQEIFRCFYSVCHRDFIRSGRLEPSFTGIFKYSIALFAVIAFCGATHDIVADGTYISFLTNKEQAKYIGWQGAFYNLAKIISSGALVYFAGVLEKTKGVTHAWMIIMAIYAVVFFALAMYHSWILPKENNEEQKVLKTAGNIRKELLEVITSFFTKPKILWCILFIILYRFAEGFAIKIARCF